LVTFGRYERILGVPACQVVRGECPTNWRTEWPIPDHPVHHRNFAHEVFTNQTVATGWTLAARCQRGRGLGVLRSSSAGGTGDRKKRNCINMVRFVPLRDPVPWEPRPPRRKRSERQNSFGTLLETGRIPIDTFHGVAEAAIGRTMELIGGGRHHDA
jgi:hypothetical protein